MSVSYLNNGSFAKRVISALEDLNTLDFETVESAFTRLITDLAHNLSEIVDVYRAHTFEISASTVIDVTDRLLERNNKDFLEDRVNYVNEIDLEFKNKSVEYAQICLKCLNLKKKRKKEELIAMFSSLLEHEKVFQDAIKEVRLFSQQKRDEAKTRKVTHLPKYESTFIKLNNLADLTWLKAKERLIKNQPIF
jgi:hypothetical protein